MYIVHTDKHQSHATGDVRSRGVRYVVKEVPARAETILAAVTHAGLGPVIPPQDYGWAPILAVHDARYVNHLQTYHQQCLAHYGEAIPILSDKDLTPFRPVRRPDDFAALRSYYTYDNEDPILEGTCDAAYWSAQCALTAAALVYYGQRTAYALCRPPGHHATAEQYGGFCYLNNASIAARWLRDYGDIALLDVDYHHGNGTQSIFYTDPRVLYVSIHADPAYDYPFFWGFADERGAGPGTGANVNLPLPIGSDDRQYHAALTQALETITRYNPCYLVVSVGHDAVGGDTIGKFNTTRDGWADVARRVASLALPTVLIQEGGYRLDTLGSNAVSFLEPFI